MVLPALTAGLSRVSRWLALSTVTLLLGACSGSEPNDPARVRFIEVAASNYKLELAPPFDEGVTSYTARANGPGIEVYVDVFMDRDVDGVLVNDVPAALTGYRAWRSSAEADLVAPTFAVVEVLDESTHPAVYEIKITVP